MKRIFKFTVTLLMGLIVISLQACKNDENEPEVRIPVTTAEIQGTWGLVAFGWYHTFTFTGNEYFYARMNTKNNVIEHKESGTYSIDGLSIDFRPRSGTSDLFDCEIYWESPSKDYFHIYPIGTMLPVK